jgi:hypothetical protein
VLIKPLRKILKKKNNLFRFQNNDFFAEKTQKKQAAEHNFPRLLLL